MLGPRCRAQCVVGRALRKRWTTDVAHIQKRSGKWQARYRGPDGRERSARFDRKIDAQDWLDTNSADIARGQWIDPRAGRVMFRDYANSWLEHRHDIRASTRSKWRGLLDLHIVPTFGDTQLGDLSPSAVRRWNSELAARFPSTAASAYRLLSSICRTAVDDELIGRSPCKVKGAASEHSAERPTATIAQLARAVEATPGRWKLAILLASWCQLRRGEILGLQRKDIDLLHGVISIERTWTVVSGSGPILGPPKTEAGQRQIAIPSNIREALTSHLGKHVAIDRASWLFPGGDGIPAHPQTLDHAWRKSRAVVGRDDLRFHDLRHSGLTWAAATGASTAELMRRAGHRSPNAALRYQHATSERDRALAHALAELAGAATVTPITGAADNPRTANRVGGSASDSTGTPTSDNTEQSQRGSNPCSHLERVVS
jgi:integrase